MKRLCLLWLAICIGFCSCGEKADFVIPRETTSASHADDGEEMGILVLINKNSEKYHLDPECVYASHMSEANRLEIKVKNEGYLLAHGYTPCVHCSSKK